VTDSVEHRNEPSGSLKCWEFFEWVNNSWLLKKDSPELSPSGFGMDMIS
jgi:hypothetical protein